MIYSDKVMDHFANPRNVGTLPDADGVGKVGNPVCGDMMSFYIKVKDDKLADIKFQTFGCGAAIAVSAMKWTPQKTMTSWVTAAAFWLSSSESPTKSATSWTSPI